MFPGELAISCLLVQSSLKIYEIRISSSNLYCFVYCFLESVLLITLILSHSLIYMFCPCFLCTFLVFLGFSIQYLPYECGHPPFYSLKAIFVTFTIPLIIFKCDNKYIDRKLIVFPWNSTLQNFEFLFCCKVMNYCILLLQKIRTFNMVLFFCGLFEVTNFESSELNNSHISQNSKEWNFKGKSLTFSWWLNNIIWGSLEQYIWPQNMAFKL